MAERHVHIPGAEMDGIAFVASDQERHLHLGGIAFVETLVAAGAAVLRRTHIPFERHNLTR